MWQRESDLWPAEDEAPPALYEGPSLDDAQRQAAETTARHVLVVAGPGSGKTRTLHGRVAHLLREGVRPERLLVLVFTNAAAKELVRRTGGMELPHVGTFHSLMLRLVVRPYMSQLGLTRSAPADEDDVVSILGEVVKVFEKEHPGLSLPSGRKEVSELAEAFSLAKEAMGAPSGEVEKALFDLYNAELVERGLVDFSDMLALPVRLMRADATVAAEVAGNFDHVLVDEAQDLNACQVELLRLLCSEGASFFAVGDPAQSIYGFRGAVPGIGEVLAGIFPGLKRYDLLTSYRCPMKVLELANRTGASDLTLVPSEAARQRQGTVVLACKCSAPDQGAQVARWVARLISEGKVPPSDVAVLYRMKGIPGWDAEGWATGLRRKLRDLKVPFVELGERSLLGHKEVAMLVNFALWASSPFGAYDHRFPAVREWLSPALDLDFGQEALAGAMADAKATGRPLRYCLAGRGRWRKDRCPCGSGGSRLVELVIEADDHIPDGPLGFLQWAVERTGLRPYLARRGWGDEYLEELLLLARDSQAEGATLGEFLEGLLLGDATEAPAGRVTLATAHKAKGLEWPHVFLLRVDDQVWPCTKAIEAEEVDEEMRLFYVAVTRAKESLYLTCSQPSPFLWAVRGISEEEAVA